MAGRKRCSRRLAQSARSNAKFLLSPGRIALFIARIVFQNARIAAARIFGALFVVTGALHFLKTDTYIKVIPPYLPFQKALVLVSGAVSVVLGALLMAPRTNRAAAWGIILFLIAVFPANIHMAFHPEIFPSVPVWVGWARLPFQIVLIAWAACYTAKG